MNDDDIHALFIPELPPQRMLELGVFGGSYFADGPTTGPDGVPKDLPPEWFVKAALSDHGFDPALNCFGVAPRPTPRGVVGQGLDYPRRSVGLVSVVLPL